jgi:hypothetical protein
MQDLQNGYYNSNFLIKNKIQAFKNEFKTMMKGLVKAK